MSIHVVLVESDQNEAERLSRSLRRHAVQIQWVDDPTQVLTTLQSALPDLLLMGWCGSRRALRDSLRTLRANTRTQHLPVIALSPYADTRSKIEALDAGADHYMAMPCTPGELQAHIRALLRRVRPPSDALPQANGLQLNPHTQKVTAQTKGGPREISLSPQEFRLLRFLVEHPQRVHTREQLLNCVWGSQVLVGGRTVDVHVRKLRAALSGTLCADLIETVRGAGYRLVLDARTTRKALQTKEHRPDGARRLPDSTIYNALQLPRRPSAWEP